MSPQNEKYIYIIGAGFAGQMIAEEIKRKKIFGEISAFIDDDPSLIGKEIDGVPVLGPLNHFISFLRQSDRDEAIIAMPTATTDRIKEVYSTLSNCGFTRIKILPAISQIIDGNAHLVQAREIDPLDILGRTPVTITLKESLVEEPVHEAVSVDGTKKYLFKTGTDKLVESVYIPDKERATLCVSSQMGCKMNCLFCMTGKQGFNGNLTANEIINQIFSIPDSESLTNIVFMGMGEPMDNYDELIKVLQILTSEWGLAWSPKRITVSTIGVEKYVRRFLDESNCHLAVSLHASYSEQRLSLMPVEKVWKMENIISLLKEYDFSKQRRLSFEYIMFHEYNDSLEDAKKLVALLKGVDCRVNLIRFHAIPNVDLKSSDEESMIKFRDYLNNHGITCTIRSSRGEDIFAACGMLSTKKQ